MTEQEFFKQIWHAYDTVEISGGIKGSVVNICFPTRSVRVSVSNNVLEWFKCDLIEKHKSKAGYADDDDIVEGLHNQIMKLEAALEKSNEKIEKKQEEIDALRNKFTIDSYLGLKSAVNRLAESLAVKKKMIEQADECYNKVLELINQKEDGE